MCALPLLVRARADAATATADADAGGGGGGGEGVELDRLDGRMLLAWQSPLPQDMVAVIRTLAGPLDDQVAQANADEILALAAAAM